MKKFNFYLSRIVLMVAAVVSISLLKSCKEEDMPYLSLSEVELTFDQYQHSSPIIEVYTNASFWQAVSSDASWCRVLGNGSGKYKGSIQLSIEANNVPLDRQATITVNGNNGQSANLIVRQSSRDAGLTLSPSTVNFNVTGTVIENGVDTGVPQEKIINVTSNFDWIVTASQDWVQIGGVTPSQVNPATTTQFIITVLPNTTGKQREAVVTVTTADNGKDRQTKEVLVIQAGMEIHLFVEPKTGSVTKAGGELVMSVTSNSDWMAQTSDPVNCVISEPAGMTTGGQLTSTGNQTVKLTVTENTTDQDREFTVTFWTTTASTGDPITQTYTVKQSASQFFLDPAVTEITIPAQAAFGNNDPIVSSLMVNTNLPDWKITSSDGTNLYFGAAGTATQEFTGNTSTVNPVAFNVTANTTNKERKFVLTLTCETDGVFMEPRVVTVTQEALTISLIIDGPNPVIYSQDEVAADAGEEFTIRTNSPENVRLKLASTAAWVTGNPALPATINAPANDATFTVGVAKNETGAERKATIVATTTVNGIDYTASFEVVQTATKYFMNVTGDDLSIEFTDAQYDADAAAAADPVLDGKMYTLNTNLPASTTFALTTPASWIALSPAPDYPGFMGGGAATLLDFYVGAAKNTTNNERNGVITLKSSEVDGQFYTVTINVKQAAPADFILEPASESVIEVDQAGVTDQAFLINTNLEFPEVAGVNYINATSENPSWLTVAKSASFETDLTLEISVAPFTGIGERTGYIKVKGSQYGSTKEFTITVRQQGSAPKYLVYTMSAIDVPVEGYTTGATTESITVDVLTNIAIAPATNWTVTSQSGWCQAAFDADMNVVVTVDANTGAARSTSIKVTAKDADNDAVYTYVIAVNQAAADGNNIMLSQTALTLEWDNTSDNNVPYTSNPDVTGYVSSDPSWCTVALNGGNIVVTATSENTSSLPRTAVITITAGTAQATLTVTQKAQTMGYFLVANSPVMNASAAGESFNAVFTTNVPVADLTATSSNTAVVATVGPLSAGTLPGTVTLPITVEPTVTHEQRTVTITVTGETPDGQAVQATVTITQAGNPALAPFLTLSSTSFEFPDANAVGTAIEIAEIMTNMTVILADASAYWLSPEITTSAPFLLSVTADENTSVNPRTATITVTGTNATGAPLTATITVTQPGAAAPETPYLNLSTSAYEFADNAAVATAQTIAQVLTNMTTVTATSSAGWLTVTTPVVIATGLQVTATENTTTTPRTGIITVTGTNATGAPLTATITVTQPGAALYLYLSNSSYQLSDSGLIATEIAEIFSNITRTAPPGNITGASSVPWITDVLTDSNRVAITCAANPGPNPRTGIITVTGQDANGLLVATATITVTQAAP